MLSGAGGADDDDAGGGGVINDELAWPPRPDDPRAHRCTQRCLHHTGAYGGVGGVGVEPGSDHGVRVVRQAHFRQRGTLRSCRGRSSDTNSTRGGGGVVHLDLRICGLTPVVA